MPIILITGYLSAISATTILDKVADILAKPFDLTATVSSSPRARYKSALIPLTTSDLPHFLSL